MSLSIVRRAPVVDGVISQGARQALLIGEDVRGGGTGEGGADNGGVIGWRAIL